MIQISELKFSYGEIFTLEDFAALEDHESICYISRDLQSVNYHVRCIEDGDGIVPIIIRDDNELLDGFHRIAAIAYWNHFQDKDHQITEVECIIDNNFTN